jgi:sortase A
MRRPAVIEPHAGNPAAEAWLPPEPDVLPSTRRGVPPCRRPKPPHDWRWVVGGIGKTLISIGLLMFGFVAYQLWGTGIQYAQAQDRLEHELDELLASAATAAPATSSTAPTTTPTSSPVATPTTAPTPATSAEAAPSTVAPEPAVAAPPPVDPAIELLALGGALGRIDIPRIEMSGVVVAGVRMSDLKKGVGHYPDTPLPGQQGNAAIAGHRTTYGAPFYRIDELVPGDPITVTTVQGTFRYLVTGTVIVAPSEYAVVADQPDKVMLTLTSCEPKYSAKRRIVVTAELDTSGSDPVEEPVVNYGRPEPLPTGSDQSDPDPATVVDEGEGAPATTATAAAEEAEEIAAVDSADAFSDGWFSDDAAYGQVALWGFVVSGVALAFTVLGRRTRNWIGALAGIGPFLVVLYFFFQNVNRLLPPNL